MTEPRKPTRAAFAFVFVTVALDMLALGVMIPVLPELIQELTGHDTATAVEWSGIFGFAWAAMQFVFSPLIGALSDRVGRRPVILISNFGLGLDYVLMALAPSLSWLFVGRLVSGLTASSFSTASAYVADVTPPEERASKFGQLGAAFGLGFVIGPAIGGLLGAYSLRLPLWFAAGLSLVNALYGLFVLPESLPKEKRAPFDWRRANPIGAIGLLRTHPVLLGIAIAIFVEQLGHESLSSVFVLYADHRYGWGETEVGLTLAGVGVCSTIVSAALVTPVVARLGERRTMLLGVTFGVIGLFAFGAAPIGPMFLVGVPFVALWGMGGAAEQAIMSSKVAPDAQGRLQGATASVISMAGLFAPLMYTRLLAYVVRHPALPQGAPYLLATVLLALALAMLAWVTRKEPKHLPRDEKDQSTG